jgi:hypothetical protein
MAGLVACALWNRLGSRWGDAGFWPGLRRIAVRMATGEAQQDFLHEYVQLLKLLALYLGRMGVRVSLTVLPVAMTVMLVGPVGLKRELDQADRLRVTPPRSLDVEIAGSLFQFDETGTCHVAGPLPRGPLELPGTSTTQPALEFNGAVALTQAPVAALGLSLVGLRTECRTDGPSLLILRASNEQTNPFWPYLGNLEFAFWSGLLGASVLAGLATCLVSRPGAGRVPHSVTSTSANICTSPAP